MKSKNYLSVHRNKKAKVVKIHSDFKELNLQTITIMQKFINAVIEATERLTASRMQTPLPFYKNGCNRVHDCKKCKSASIGSENKPEIVIDAKGKQKHIQKSKVIQMLL